MRGIGLVIGVLVFLAGVVFTLQGVGILNSGAMANNHTWAVLGPIIALVGLVIAVMSSRRQKA